MLLLRVRSLMQWIGIAGGTATCLLLIGQISAQDAPLEELFERLDTDGDERLSSVELEAQGKKTGWVKFADKDGDSVVSLVEAKDFFAKRRVSVADPASAPDGETSILVHEFPESSSVNELGCRAAAEYSAQRNGYSALVMVDGQVVFERYDQGWGPAKPHRLASGTKSFSGAILSVGVKDGLLELDEPVAKTITEWTGDKALEAITIRHLLSLTSGLSPGMVGMIPAYTDAIKLGKLDAMRRAPGDKFAYGPRPYQIFGEVIRRKLGLREDLEFADPLEYLKARVFEPIGMEFAEWKRDANGMPRLPSGAHLTAREWVKYGELLLNEGRVGDLELLDSETLKQCLRGSLANPGYGLTFWLLDKDNERVAERPWLKGAYMAAGAGKQKLYVLPQAGVVMVRQGESRQFEDLELLDQLFKID